MRNYAIVLFVASSLFREAVLRNITQHTVVWLYSCCWCGKKFRCKSDLNQHTKLHTGDAHMCCICGKVFTKHPNGGSHLQTQKPYVCHTKRDLN